MTRRTLLSMAALPVAAPRPVNVVLILMDDMGWKDLGCQGNPVFETPNIDRLGREGIRFTNAYAACPVCSPTRASIMTGKYPARLRLTDWIPGRKQWPTARVLTPDFRQQLPHEEQTIAELLKPLGYRTAAIGKWHLGGEGFWPETQGFDIHIAGDHRGSPKSYFGPFDLPNLKGGSRDDYLADRLVDEAIRFMGQDRSRPFFLYLPHFSVHMPLQAQKRWIDYYDAKRRPGGPEFNSTYAAMVHHADLATGRLLAALDELKLSDNTLVLFTSDNGGLRFEGGRSNQVTSNAPLRAGKGHLYEGGIREPLLVRWPGVVKPGSVSDTPVCSVDLLPTLCEAAGGRERASGAVDGVSLAPLLRGRKLKPRPIFWHYPHYSNQGGVPSSAVRDGDYKLIEFLTDGRLELFHLGRDLGERQNLARKEARTAERLHGMLREWRKSVNAAMPVSNPAFDADKEDQGLRGAEPNTQPI